LKKASKQPEEKSATTILEIHKSFNIKHLKSADP